MCASYGLQITADEARDEFSTMDERSSMPELVEWLDAFRDQKVLPTGSRALNLNPIVRERTRDGRAERSIDLAWWRLWVGGGPAKFPAINARVEKLLDSGAWSGPIRSRRAIVPATLYYEKGHRFDLDGAPFGMAGIYNVTKQASGEWMLSYAIVTRPAIDRFADIHDRMPLVLPREFYGDWLDPEATGDAELVGAALGASGDIADRLTVRPV